MDLDREAADQPLFANLNDDDPALFAAVTRARETLSQFKAAVRSVRFAPAAYLVKVPFLDWSDLGNKAVVRTPDAAICNPTRPVAHLWLRVTSVLDDLLFCCVAEAPVQFRLNEGDTFVIQDEIIEDWMIVHAEVAYGGYSMRVIRERLPKNERNRFDSHTGIREFNEMP